MFCPKLGIYMKISKLNFRQILLFSRNLVQYIFAIIGGVVTFGSKTRGGEWCCFLYSLCFFSPNALQSILLPFLVGFVAALFCTATAGIDDCSLGSPLASVRNFKFKDKLLYIKSISTLLLSKKYRSFIISHIKASTHKEYSRALI